MIWSLLSGLCAAWIVFGMIIHIRNHSRRALTAAIETAIEQRDLAREQYTESMAVNNTLTKVLEQAERAIREIQREQQTATRFQAEADAIAEELNDKSRLGLADKSRLGLAVERSALVEQATFEQRVRERRRVIAEQRRGTTRRDIVISWGGDVIRELDTGVFPDDSIQEEKPIKTSPTNPQTSPTEPRPIELDLSED